MRKDQVELLINEGIDLVNERIEAIGAVDASMLKRIKNGLTLLNGQAPKKGKPTPITVILSTYGGDADIALGIYDLIKYNPRPVRVCAIGPCMSAGTIIMQAAWKRAALPSASFLIHFGSENAGSRNEWNMNLYRTDYINILFSERTKQSIKVVERWHAGESYFTPAQALKNNLIDEVVEAL